MKLWQLFFIVAVLASIKSDTTDGTLGEVIWSINALAFFICFAVCSWRNK